MKKIYLFILLLPLFCIAQKLEGQKLIDSLLVELPKMKEDTLKVNMLNNLGFNYRNTNINLSNKYNNMAKNLAEKINFNNGLATAYVNIAYNNIALSELDLAFKNYNIAYQLNPNEKIKGQIYLGYGLYYFSKNYFDKALLNLNKALSIFEKHQLKSAEIAALNNIANVYKENKNYKKAIQLYLKSLQLNKVIGSTINDEIRLTNISSCYFLMNDFDTSLKYLNLALQTKTLLSSNKALIYGNIGNVYLNKLEYDKGSFYINKAIELNKKLKDNYGLSKNYIYLGYLYLEKSKLEKGILQTNNLTKAKNYLQNSIVLEKEMNNELNSWYQYQLLSEINKLQGNYKESLEYHEKYVLFKDSIFNADNKETIKNLEDKREIELRDNKLKINQLELNSKEKQKWYLFGGLGLLTIIGGLLFYQSRKRKQINLKLETLNKDLDQANKAKTRFFGILNHDLRGPVANLVFFLQLQQESPEMLDEESIKRMQNKTMTGAENLLSTMEDILQWSKSQMENFKPQPKLFAVNQLFDDTKKVFSGYLKIEFEYQNPNNIEVFTDENYLKTIIRNLTSNAINAFTSTENPKIIWKAWQNNDKTYFSITDNGPGANEEQFKALFEDTEITSAKSGLGLYLIKDMAKAIDCKITVDSKIGVGTTFILKL